MHINFDSILLETFDELNKLYEDDASIVAEQDWQQALQDALAVVEPAMLEQFLTIYNTTVDTITLYMSSNSYIGLNIAGKRSAYIYKVDMNTPDKVSALVSVLNTAIPTLLKEAKETSNNAIDVFNAMNKGGWNITSAMAVLLGDSGKLYTVESECPENRRYRATTANSIFDVKEPYKVIYVKAVRDDNNRFTYRDSTRTTYHSWDSSESDKITEYIPTVGETAGTWSNTKTEKTKPLGFPGHSTMDNIDSWATTTYTSYATD